MLIQVHAGLVAKLALDLAAAVVQRAHSINQAACSKISLESLYSPNASCGQWLMFSLCEQELAVTHGGHLKGKCCFNRSRVP